MYLRCEGLSRCQVETLPGCVEFHVVHVVEQFADLRLQQVLLTDNVGHLRLETVWVKVRMKLK